MAQGKSILLLTFYIDIISFSEYNESFYYKILFTNIWLKR